MRILLDTNVVLRLDDTGHVQHSQARAAVDWIDVNGHDPVILPQVMYEYWVVATRAVEHNGLGLTTAKASQAIDQWATVFRLLRDERGVFRVWNDLVTIHDVKGKNAHDARFAAAMKRHGLTHIVMASWNWGGCPKIVAMSEDSHGRNGFQPGIAGSAALPSKCLKLPNVWKPSSRRGAIASEVCCDLALNLAGCQIKLPCEFAAEASNGFCRS